VTKIKLEYEIVHDMHFVTSDQVPGLCAGHMDIETAFKEAAMQIAELTKHREAYLESTFGEAYLAYKRRVRRWI